MSGALFPMHPKVFVSYSHDNAEHRKSVLDLAQRLRSDGFEASIDQYVEGTPPQGWPRWMLNQIDWADFVLLVCTQTYYSRFRGHELPEVGKGVDWEGAVITNELYANKSVSLRFVPVLFASGDSNYIPEPVNSSSFYDLSSEEAYERLTDFMAGVAGIQPAELGSSPMSRRKTGAPLNDKKTDLEQSVGRASSGPTTKLNGFFAPGGAMRSDNNFHIERRADHRSREAAARPCETFVIKGPRQFGKSTLLARYLARCREGGKSVALVSFSGFEGSIIANYSSLLSSLALELARCLKVAPPTGRLQRQQAFNKYVESMLLPQLNCPVVFGFDETDRIMQQGYSEDFFSMLRMWHDKRADPAGEFNKLGLALVTSSEPKLFIKDPLNSPFSVGETLELEPFTDLETAKLNGLYGNPLSESDCMTLWRLVAGHPFLIQEAFYRLCGPSPISFKKLQAEASEDIGPFGAHLRAMLSNVKSANLLEVLRKAIRDGIVEYEDDFYRLEGAGLVRRQNRRIIPANTLYEQFFQIRE